MGDFVFSERSLRELHGVHPHLIGVVHDTLKQCDVDFAVHDGIRTLDEQRKLVDAGVSQTMNSRHLTGHAVDLVPVVNGKLRWEWKPIYRIARALQIAANQRKVVIIWGGCWGPVNPGYAIPDPQALMEGYGAERRRQGKTPFFDGPHFELPRKDYPPGGQI